MCTAAKKTASIPRGLVATPLTGRARSLHEAVTVSLGGMALEVACAARLEFLRTLVADGECEAAVELSLALDEALDAASRRRMPAGCTEDAAFVARADVVIKVSTGDGHTHGARSGNRTAVALFADGTSAPITSRSLRFKRTARAAPLVGFILDGKLVATETTMRCAPIAHAPRGLLECRQGGERGLRFAHAQAAARHARRSPAPLLSRTTILDAAAAAANDDVDDDASSKKGAKKKTRAAGASATRPRFASRLQDEETDYVLGTKTLLVIPICPSDVVDCDTAWDYGLINSEHEGSISSFMQAAVLSQGRPALSSSSSLSSSSLSSLSSSPSSSSLRVAVRDARRKQKESAPGMSRL